MCTHLILEFSNLYLYIHVHVHVLIYVLSFSSLVQILPNYFHNSFVTIIMILSRKEERHHSDSITPCLIFAPILREFKETLNVAEFDERKRYIYSKLFLEEEKIQQQKSRFGN